MTIREGRWSSPEDIRNEEAAAKVVGLLLRLFFFF